MKTKKNQFHILVAIPEEKKNLLRWGKPVDSITLMSWESLSRKTSYKRLPKYNLVIASPYFAGTVGEDYQFVRKPVEKALHDYLWGGGNCIFLIPGTKYALRIAYEYVVKKSSRAKNVKSKVKIAELAWELILSDTLGLIEYCLTSRQKPTSTVGFPELTLDQQVEYVVTGPAKKALSSFLRNRAPKKPQREIVLRVDNAKPLAYYSYNRSKYAAVRVTVGKRGSAILLPFDGNNIAKNDVNLLVRLHNILQKPPEETVGIVEIDSSEMAADRKAPFNIAPEPISDFSPPSPDMPEVNAVTFRHDSITIDPTAGDSFVIKAKYESNPGRAARLLVRHRLHDMNGAGYLTVKKGEKIERLRYSTMSAAISDLNIDPDICCSIQFFRSARSNGDIGYAGWRFEPAPTYEIIDAVELQSSKKLQT